MDKYEIFNLFSYKCLLKLYRVLYGTLYYIVDNKDEQSIKKDTEQLEVLLSIIKKNIYNKGQQDGRSKKQIQEHLKQAFRGGKCSYEKFTIKNKLGAFEKNSITEKYIKECIRLLETETLRSVAWGISEGLEQQFYVKLRDKVEIARFEKDTVLIRNLIRYLDKRIQKRLKNMREKR